MTNYHFLLFVCIMELQLLNADLMQTRKPAFFKDTEFLFLVCIEGTEMCVEVEETPLMSSV